MNWHKIETAPKDGTSILATDIRRGDECAAVYWDRTGWNNTDYEPTRMSPTHWMPLPSPPEDT